MPALADALLAGAAAGPLTHQSLIDFDLAALGRNFWGLTIEHFLLREVPDGDLLGVPSSLGDDTSQVGRSCLLKAGVVQDLYEPVV